MQLPEPPPPPLAPLWDRVIRARALPPDLDVQLLYVAIRDRLVHPEWEVRLHALRVLADLLPLSGNALSFPFDQVVDNLGHSSPNVRKAALDALKVFCNHCEDSECAARAILDKCSYRNIRPHSANIDNKVNVITGLILSIPSLMSILKRRNPGIDAFPIFKILGDKLFDPIHRDVAQRSLLKLRRVCGPRDYMMYLSRLDVKVQDKFRHLCEIYDEDSMDVYYAPRKSIYRDNNNQTLLKINHVFSSPITTPIRMSTDSSSEESFTHIPFYNNNYAKVIIETEIKFDADTAITMTVLEENDSETDKNSVSNTGSEEDGDSTDRNMLKFSDVDSEDTDVVVKKVRFGGESVKIRTPDSENLLSSEDDNNINKIQQRKDHIDEISKTNTPVIVNKMNEIKREALERENVAKPIKKSGIPLPVIQNKSNQNSLSQYKNVKLKSKSLSELYDYFRSKNDEKVHKSKEVSSFALTLAEVRSPEKIPSPVEPHREVEVLHNLQRSPVVSPRRHSTRLHLERDGFVLNLLASSPNSELDIHLVSPQPASPLRVHYKWEDLDVVPGHVVDQLHNTENWISVVKAADQLHSALLDVTNVRKVEPVALSLVQHMWALGDAVSSARAPAEGAVCALVRSANNDCIRQLLPALIARMTREPLPTALPHALLQRLALHHVVDLIFDPSIIEASGDTDRVQSAQLRATLCLARAAGPAAVLSAVRRRLANTARADVFCAKLRERLSRPVENVKPNHFARSSQLPVPVRRRARSTPSPAAPAPPRRLRPLPDSAPLPGVIQPGREYYLKPLSPIPLSDRDSSAFTSYEEKADEKKIFTEIDNNSNEAVIIGDTTHISISESDVNDPPPPPRSPSIKVEDYSEKSYHSTNNKDVRLSQSPVINNIEEDFGSQKSINSNILDADGSRPPSRKSSLSLAKSRSPSPSLRKSRNPTPSPAKSRNPSPDPISDVYDDIPSPCQRDVRNALAECVIPARHEDWEVIVNGLLETERLAADPSARAPAASWRAAVRGTAAHVRSLRSRVARTACSTLGTLFEYHGRALDTELEEAATALLDRCADVNRFLRADAASALVRMACGSNSARAAVALARRGASHRAGPVRAAAVQALAKLVQYHGASKTLDMPSEPRTVLLRAAGESLGDANAETRVHARQLCLALSYDMRFRQMLKDAMTPSRYRAIEKLIGKLR
ncbi:unnamed protein product [Diatraea saccharalis]|uniref:CLASP N-terminal domain-containing protein n=1 Tax=Diatraea saccharalis TaxID=40085 RepID=A0A9N9WAG0_9NEOP|nr:unnamed protein product [Diatraea saccharalis]